MNQFVKVVAYCSEMVMIVKKEVTSGNVELLSKIVVPEQRSPRVLGECNFREYFFELFLEFLFR